jgi:hypothetical protein
LKLLVGTLGLLLVGVGSAQEASKPVAASAEVSFHFERQGLTIPVYTLTVRENGEATFAEGDQVPAKALHLRPETVGRIFEQARALDGFRAGCNSRSKNLADTGAKTLTVSAPGAAPVSCTYNYSDNKAVSALTETFLALEFTIEEGQKLEHDHRFDRLGLDQDIRYLVEAAKENRAQGLAAIAPILKSLVDDTLVIERVRTAAGKLLEMASLGR